MMPYSELDIGVPPPNHEEQREGIEFIVNQMDFANAVTAAVTADAIRLKYNGREEPLPDGERREFKVELDNIAGREFERILHSLPFRTFVVEAEGAKEFRKDGTDVYMPNGHYGLGKTFSLEDRHGLRDHADAGDTEIMADNLEGTDIASRNGKRPDGSPGDSIAVTGGSISGGLTRLPEESGPLAYMDRVIGSPRMRDLIGVDQPIEKNIEAVMKAFSLSDPHDVTLIVLGTPKRTRNDHLILPAREMGARVIELDSGDLVPALYIASHDVSALSVGSGGKPEGAIAAYVAKAQDAAFDARWVDKNGLIVPGFDKTFGLDTIAPGSRYDYFGSFAAVSGATPFGMPKAKYHGPNGRPAYNDVHTAHITSKGIRKSVYPILTL